MPLAERNMLMKTITVLAIVAIIAGLGYVTSSSFMLSAAAFSTTGSDCGFNQSTDATEKGGRDVGQGTALGAQTDNPSLGALQSAGCIPQH
jgi:hypothetical protein